LRIIVQDFPAVSKGYTTIDVTVLGLEMRFLVEFGVRKKVWASDIGWKEAQEMH
jgi:hypothetical protein